MIATVLLTLLAIPGAFILWSAKTLQENKAKAKATGLPILIRWVSPINPFWLMKGNTIVNAAKKLGIATESFRRYYPFGWEANERHHVHQEIGLVFMLVTPGGLWCCICDANVVADVIQRRTDFRRNMEQFAIVNVYGKNLSTTDDEEWQKHRKVTGATFTEKNNELVWRQSLTQACGMQDYWLQHQPVNTIADDTKVFTLNVLATAMFNKSYSFKGAAEADTESAAQDESYQYRDSLGRMFTHIVPLFVFGQEGLQAWWTPKSWKAAGAAVSTYRSYVTKLINEERNNMAQGAQKNQTLLAALVRACDSEHSGNSQTAPGMRSMTLTEEEIISNLFVFGFAGNDTSAIALTNLLVHMAAFPEAQEWIAEEIRYYFAEDDVSQWNYKTVSKLKRCLAVVMESLRLTHPLSQLVKETGKFSQPLKVGDRTHILPPGTAVHLSLAAMHTHPDYWGEHSMKWSPEKFISTPDGVAKTLENEVVAPSTQHHYQAWASGMRVCPGIRFSQVELLAVLVVIFRDYTLQPQTRSGETLQQARERIFQASLDIEHEGKILHEMRSPESVALMWKKRV